MQKTYILLLLLIVSILIFPSIRYVKFAERADEGYYLKYADTLTNKGLLELGNLFKDYIGHKENWLFPNPLRIGLFFISSIWCKIFGSSFMTLAYLSFFSYLLLIILNYIFSSKFFGRETAIFLSFLVAFSPINMAMSRRALSDSITTLFLAMSIWLFLDMIHHDKSTVKKIVFLIIFSSSILVKETSVLLVIPFFIFIFIYQIKFKGKIKWQDFLYLLVYPGVIVLAVYLIFSKNIFIIIEVVKAVSTAVKTNEYAILFGSGPWYRYIIDYMLLSPWTLLLSVGYVFYMILYLDKIEINEIYFLIVILASFLLFNFFTKNVRYVMILDMPMRLFSVLMLKKIITVRFPKYTFILIAILIITISVFDYINFHTLFLKDGIYDPVSFLLLKSKRLIP